MRSRRIAPAPTADSILTSKSNGWVCYATSRKGDIALATLPNSRPKSCGNSPRRHPPPASRASTQRDRRADGPNCWMKYRRHQVTRRPRLGGNAKARRDGTGRARHAPTRSRAARASLGNLWRDGTITAAHERFACATSRLPRAGRQTVRRHGQAPELVVATPAGTKP